MRDMAYPSCRVPADEFISSPDWTDAGDGVFRMRLDCQSTDVEVRPSYLDPSAFDWFADDDKCAIHEMGTAATFEDAVRALHGALSARDRMSPCRLCTDDTCPHDDCSARVFWDDETIDTPEAYEPGGTWRCSACYEELDEDWLESDMPPEFCPGCGRKLRGNPFAPTEDETM